MELGSSAMPPAKGVTFVVLVTTELVVAVAAPDEVKLLLHTTVDPSLDKTTGVVPVTPVSSMALWLVRVRFEVLSQT